jgi:hypothetical protein
MPSAIKKILEMYVQNISDPMEMSLPQAGIRTEVHDLTHATGQPDRSAGRLTQRVQVTTCKFSQQLWQRHSKPPKPKYNGQPDRSGRLLTAG